MPEKAEIKTTETTPATPIEQVIETQVQSAPVQREKTMGELMGRSKTNSNTYINLFFNYPKSHSVPYSLKVGTDSASTQWAVILPGITTAIHSDVWERIKMHPDVINFMEMGVLRVIDETPDLHNAHDFSGVKAITQGNLTKGIYEPIPVMQVKQHQGIAAGNNPRLIT